MLGCHCVDVHGVNTEKIITQVLLQKKAARWGHWAKPKCRHIAPIDRIIFADGFSPFLKGTAVWKQSFCPLSFFCKTGFPTCLWLYMKCGNSKLLTAPYQCVNMQGLQDAVDTYLRLIKTHDCDTFINLDGCLRIMASQQPEINGIVPTTKVRNFLVVLKHKHGGMYVESSFELSGHAALTVVWFVQQSSFISHLDQPGSRGPPQGSFNNPLNHPLPPPTPHVASLCVIGMGQFLREAGFKFKLHSLLLCFPPTENSGPFCCPLGRNANARVNAPPPKDPQTCVFQLNKNNFSPANRWVWKVPNVGLELDRTRRGWRDVVDETCHLARSKKTNDGGQLDGREASPISTNAAADFGPGGNCDDLIETVGACAH